MAQAKKKKNVFTASENEYVVSLKVDPLMWAKISAKEQRAIKKELASLDDRLYVMIQAVTQDIESEYSEQTSPENKPKTESRTKRK